MNKYNFLLTLPTINSNKKDDLFINFLNIDIIVTLILP